MTNDTLSFNITGVILWHSDLPGTVITFVMWTALLSLGFALCCYFRKSTVWIPCAMTVLGLFVIGIWRILMNPIYDNAPVNWAAIIALGILGPVLASCSCFGYLGEKNSPETGGAKIAPARTDAELRAAAARARAAEKEEIRERIAEQNARNAEIRAKRNGKTKRPKMSMPDVDDFDC